MTSKKIKKVQNSDLIPKEVFDDYKIDIRKIEIAEEKAKASEIELVSHLRNVSYSNIHKLMNA
ncbi:hypothetical protein [Polaribacter sp. IC073]|uniref:hypothetical protein n=1 Tax=Polaribacter sp. IC073 TaxID=2508540 RepID=UPI0011BD97D0|nr:hypothetical protein [Polaribacter sp. IC073]TXD45870.1 hypothetical protein ES045_15715 [Polaribacter sp. IC073]